MMMGLLLLFLHRNTPHIDGPKQWALGSFLIGIGSFLFALYPKTTGFTAFVLAGSLAVGGLFLYHAGIRLFNGRKVNYWLMVGMPVLQLLQGTFFYFIYPFPELRISLYSTIIVFYAILVSVEFTNPPFPGIRKIYLVALLSTSIYGLIMIVRIFYSITGMIDPMISNHINILSFLIGALSQVVATYCFIAIVNSRIAEELKEEISVKNKFFNIIAHDLRGPVGTIVNFLRIANGEQIFDEKELKKHLRQLEKLGNSTYHLLQNLLEWSRDQSGTLETRKSQFDIRILIEEAIELLSSSANEKKIKIISDLGDSHILLLADRSMISTVVRNILNNAIKFTPPNGSINISLKIVSDIVQIVVEDSGVGIEANQLKDIFKQRATGISYGTDGEKGSGLGLVICSEFVKKNNGTINIQNIASKGTRVTIELPATTQKDSI